MDKSPRWTLGDPPKYVERRPRCLNYLSEGRPGTARFIPVDVTIPSTYRTRVSIFEKNWGKLQEDTKAEVLGLELKSSKTPRAPAGPRPSRAKAPPKLKSLEANFSSKQESSSTAAEEKQNEMAFRNAANAFTFDSCLATDPTHGKFVNGVVPAPDQSPTPQRPSANTLRRQTIGVISKRPPMSISDLPFLPETRSGIKRQRIA